MDYDSNVDHPRGATYPEPTAELNARGHRRFPKRHLPLIGLVAAGVVLVSAVAANAATGGRMMSLLGDSHTAGPKPAATDISTTSANGSPSVVANGTMADDPQMVDPSYSPSPRVAPHMPSVAFMTLDNPADPTFNQLLGINDSGRIAGYFGSGADAAHPNKGYEIPHNRVGFVNENFPGSAQTQVVGINNEGTTVGFFVDNSGANIGFVRSHGNFTAVANPATTAAPAFNQLLGVNNEGTAAGFYNDKDGASHGYLYQIQTGVFTPVALPVQADSVVATGVNDNGDISGFYTVAKVTTGFLIRGGHFTSLSFGGKTNTQALGLNNSDQVVGSFVDNAGNTHGFVWHDGKVKQVDDPKASGTAGTVVNGINDHNQLVGFYVDTAGNTNGFLARKISS